jgi:ethanolamine ammonia-lyase small subunit
VGGLNNIGQRRQPEVIILRIGEWTGLGRAAVRRASMASRPHAGHTDAAHGMMSNLCANSDTDPRAGAASILTLA